MLKTIPPSLFARKGVEEGTGLLHCPGLRRGSGNIDRLAALSGPNHAEEVILGVPAGTVIASRSRTTAHYFRDLFTTSYFRCYTSPDYVGVELCAAFKNVIAIAVGAVAYGFGFGDNTAAMIMTRGMAEMSPTGESLWRRRLDINGPCGCGRFDRNLHLQAFSQPFVWQGACPGRNVGRLREANPYGGRRGCCLSNHLPPWLKSTMLSFPLPRRFDRWCGRVLLLNPWLPICSASLDH